MANYNKNDPSTIQAMFNSIAKRYDLANAVLSLRLHHWWNRQLIREILNPLPNHTIVDLCCGTGDIVFNYLQNTSTPCQAYLVDFCPGMLACAREKSSKLPLSKHRLHYIEADVQQLPLATESADCVTIAYGIRNVKEPAKCIREAYRILKPGGHFGILELTQPANRFLRLGHRLYLKSILPILGKWLTDNQDAYQYLRNSIHTFIAPIDLENILIKSHFIDTRRRPLAGGIATIFLGRKPV